MASPNLNHAYHRFVEWMPRCLLPLTVYLVSCLGTCSGVSFCDATSLSVCHNRRIAQHKTFRDQAKLGKTSVGWFYGFKLHVLFNDQGELLWLLLTPGNVDDRKALEEMLEHPECNMFGKIFAARPDRCRSAQDVPFSPRQCRSVQDDALFLRKRSIVETIFDQLKNISQIEHSRRRSPQNFLVNLMCGLIAYCHQPKKPALSFQTNELHAA